MKILLLVLLLLPGTLLAQSGEGVNRTLMVQWLQDGAWDEVLAEAANHAEPDSFLLQVAGYAAYQSGDRSLAAGYYGRLLGIDSNNRQALYYRSVMLKADEEHSAALPLLQRLCRVAPAVSQYQVLLAECYSALEERSAAARHLQIARRLTPASPVIANKLAVAWVRLKAWDSAGPLLTAAMRQHPRDPSLISTAISMAYTRKQYERASGLADSLIATGKLRYEPLITALYADIALPDYPHALRIGELLLDLGSETEEVLYYTAQAHQKLGHWREADTLLRRCIARLVKPNLEAYYLAMAEGAARQGATARSAACYDTAYYLFKNPMTLYSKGLMLQTAGRKEDAARVYKRYLGLPAGKQDTAIAHYLQKVVN